MSGLYGFDIIINDTPGPAYRKVVPSAWHRGRNYAKRVNKKWRKRFGVIGIEPLLKNGQWIKSGRVLVMSSATLAMLKSQIEMAGPER